MSETRKQLPECNICRNISMILIVLYHSCILYTPNTWSVFTPTTESTVLNHLGMWLQTFCIAAFVFVSGYLYYYMVYEVQLYKGFFSIVRNKAKALLIPYAATSLLWVIPFYLIYWHGSLRDVLIKFILCTSPGQLWFLIMLFDLFVAFSAAKQIIHFDQLNISLLLVLFLILCTTSIAMEVLRLPNYFQICRAVQYAPYFLFGMMLRRCRRVIAPLMRPICQCILWICSFGLYYITLKLSSSTVNMGAYAGLTLLCGICGVVALFIASCSLTRHIKHKALVHVDSILSFSSFIIYLFHQQMIYIVYDLLNIVTVPPVIVTATAFILSILTGVFLQKLFARNYLTRFVFRVR